MAPQLLPWGSRQGVVKLALLQPVQSIRPGGCGHATVGVQEDAEAAHDQDAQEDEEEDDEGKGGLLLQRHAGIGHRAPRLQQCRGEGFPLHHPRDLQRVVPKTRLSHPHSAPPQLIQMDLIVCKQR